MVFVCEVLLSVASMAPTPTFCSSSAIDASGVTVADFFASLMSTNRMLSMSVISETVLLPTVWSERMRLPLIWLTPSPPTFRNEALPEVCVVTETSAHAGAVAAINAAHRIIRFMESPLISTN